MHPPVCSHHFLCLLSDIARAGHLQLAAGLSALASPALATQLHLRRYRAAAAADTPRTGAVPAPGTDGLLASYLVFHPSSSRTRCARTAGLVLNPRADYYYMRDE